MTRLAGCFMAGLVRWFFAAVLDVWSLDWLVTLLLAWLARWILVRLVAGPFFARLTILLLAWLA
jgi:hypothetical protein